MNSPEGEQNPSAGSQGYNTQFHFLCGSAHPEFVQRLITAGNTDINFRNHVGQTPLYFAAIHQELHKKEIIRILMENGADINNQDDEGYTVLNTMADVSYLKRYQYPIPESLDASIVECLLKHGADPNIPNNRQETPLMSACKSGVLDIVRKLIDFGANVSLRSENLDTCLHIASGSDLQSDGIIEELIQHGACFFCFNSEGEAALDLIMQSNKPNFHKDATELIKIAALVNWNRIIHYLALENFGLVLFRYCFNLGTELHQMRNIVYSENFTLSHFALRGYDAEQCLLTEDDILSRVLVTLWNERFVFYFEIIRKQFNESYLHRKLSTHFYVKNKESENVFLNEDIYKALSSYLTHKDLFNIAIAYSSPPSSSN